MIDLIAPKKSLGQNFLIDNNISRKIVNELQLEAGEKLMEIGPGTGALTTLLLENDIELTAVELDKRAVELLSRKFADKKLSIISDDVRNVSIAAIAGDGKIKVIGNIPYYISADILFLLFESYMHIERVILMVQKEVAKRVVSKPNSKDYGILGIAADLISTASIAFDVSPNCFYPKPKVTSAILHIKFNKTLTERVEFKSIMKLVKAAFSQRRKTLRNSLKTYLSSLPAEKVSAFTEKYEELLAKRAENLTTNDYIEIYKFLHNDK